MRMFILALIVVSISACGISSPGMFEADPTLIEYDRAEHGGL